MKPSLLLATLVAVPVQANSAPPAANASSAVGPRGETVYFGTVFPLKSATTEPSFVYERRVDERDGALVSTHITRDPAGVTAIHESATHSPDYALVEYTLHANQLGQSGTIRVADGAVVFERLEGSRRRVHTERQEGPVVVGPTLVGYIVRHLEALRAKQTLGVRFAVLDRLETIGFQLQAIGAAPGQTRIRMKPSSLLVGLLVDPVDFTFESATGKLVRLEGRVPPKVRAGKRWRDFDARVEYRFVADAYR